jgi:hypothetical protein
MPELTARDFSALASREGHAQGLLDKTNRAQVCRSLVEAIVLPLGFDGPKTPLCLINNEAAPGAADLVLHASPPSLGLIFPFFVCFLTYIPHLFLVVPPVLCCKGAHV